MKPLTSVTGKGLGERLKAYPNSHRRPLRMLGPETSYKPPTPNLFDSILHGSVPVLICVPMWYAVTALYRIFFG